MPDLKDVNVDEAISTLGQAGLSYVIVETDTVTGSPDTVASQDPAAGTHAGDGTSVTLVVPRTS